MVGVLTSDAGVRRAELHFLQLCDYSAPGGREKRKRLPFRWGEAGSVTLSATLRRLCCYSAAEVRKNTMLWLFCSYAVKRGPAKRLLRSGPAAESGPTIWDTWGFRTHFDAAVDEAQQTTFLDYKQRQHKEVTQNLNDLEGFAQGTQTQKHCLVIPIMHTYKFCTHTKSMHKRTTPVRTSTQIPYTQTRKHTPPN